MSDFLRYPDLASERLGGVAVYANDAFFAPVENLLREAPATFDPGRYTDHGKWMDGWETRRRRIPGHDWCVVRLGVPGTVYGVVVDTSYFRGNHPERAAIDVLRVGGAEPSWEDPELDWRPGLAAEPLEPHTANAFALADPVPATHVRLSIFPDGGVARLRVHGLPRPAPVTDEIRDLAAIANGGLVAACSDAFFSEPLNLLRGGESAGMMDGWETRRRRGPGHDWVVVRLSGRGRIQRFELDTHHFKGNYPDRCAIDTASVAISDPLGAVAEHTWREAVPETPLGPDGEHTFIAPADCEATHVRLTIHPDGGVSRFRVFGVVDRSAAPDRGNDEGTA